MTETKFPPWTIEDGASCVHILEKGRRIGAFSTVSYWQYFTKEDKARAVLAATAPDLYGAVQHALNMVETDQGPPDWDYLRSVLRKARGEAPGAEG